MRASDFKTLIVLGYVLTCVFSQWYMEHKKLEAQLNQLEEVMVSCLMHGGMYIEGVLHLCKPINVWIRKEET